MEMTSLTIERIIVQEVTKRAQSVIPVHAMKSIVGALVYQCYPNGAIWVCDRTLKHVVLTHAQYVLKVIEQDVED